jgi:hypothetical protein
LSEDQLNKSRDIFFAGENDMGEAITHNNFKVRVDIASATMDITLTKDSVDLGSVKIDTKEASRIAGVILGAVRHAYDLSGKPPPYSGKEQVDLTVVSPSGCNVGPGRKSTQTMAIFHFGDTTLGIEMPHSIAQTLGRRLMTSAAEGMLQ